MIIFATASSVSLTEPPLRHLTKKEKKKKHFWFTSQCALICNQSCGHGLQSIMNPRPWFINRVHGLQNTTLHMAPFLFSSAGPGEGGLCNLATANIQSAFDTFQIYLVKHKLFVNFGQNKPMCYSQGRTRVCTLLSLCIFFRVLDLKLLR